MHVLVLKLKYRITVSIKSEHNGILNGMNPAGQQRHKPSPSSQDVLQNTDEFFRKLIVKFLCASTTEKFWY